MKYADGTEIRVGDTLVCNLTCVVDEVCPFRMVPGDGGEHVRVVTPDGDEHAIYAHSIKRDGWDRKPTAADWPFGDVRRGPIVEVTVGRGDTWEVFTVGENAERIEHEDMGNGLSCVVVYADYRNGIRKGCFPDSEISSVRWDPRPTQAVEKDAEPKTRWCVFTITVGHGDKTETFEVGDNATRIEPSLGGVPTKQYPDFLVYSDPKQAPRWIDGDTIKRIGRREDKAC